MEAPDGPIHSASPSSELLQSIALVSPSKSFLEPVPIVICPWREEDLIDDIWIKIFSFLDDFPCRRHYIGSGSIISILDEEEENYLLGTINCDLKFGVSLVCKRWKILHARTIRSLYLPIRLDLTSFYNLVSRFSLVNKLKASEVLSSDQHIGPFGLYLSILSLDRIHSNMFTDLFPSLQSSLQVLKFKVGDLVGDFPHLKELHATISSTTKFVLSASNLKVLCLKMAGEHDFPNLSIFPQLESLSICDGYWKLDQICDSLKGLASLKSFEFDASERNFPKFSGNHCFDPLDLVFNACGSSVQALALKGVCRLVLPPRLCLQLRRLSLINSFCSMQLYTFFDQQRVSSLINLESLALIGQRCENEACEEWFDAPAFLQILRQFPSLKELYCEDVVLSREIPDLRNWILGQLPNLDPERTEIDWHDFQEEDSMDNIDDNVEYGGEGMTIYDHFEVFKHCPTCRRRVIVSVNETDRVHEGVRQMGDNWLVSYEGSIECPVCTAEVDAEIDESIYIVAGGSYSFNAEERSPVLILERISFDFSEIQWSFIPSITLLDQNKGDSFFIRIGSVLIVYDTGYANNFSSLETELSRHLPSATALLIVVSHRDQDHSGGFNQLISFINQRSGRKRLAYAHVLYEAGGVFRAFNCLSHNDDTLNDREIEFNIEATIRVLCYMADSMITDSNRRSIIMVMQYGDSISCFTGDQELPMVLSILQKFPTLKLFAFQVPHHGSKHNYGGAQLPKAKCYLISGVPQHGTAGDRAQYNQECQRLAVQNASRACGTESFRIFFTRLEMNPNEIRQIAPYVDTSVPFQPGRQTHIIFLDDSDDLSDNGEATNDDDDESDDDEDGDNDDDTSED